MKIDKLKSILFEALLEPLPGKDAHLLMSPQTVDLRRFSFDTPQNHRKSGVLVLFYPEDGNGFFPLIKRPIYSGVHSGQVALPGGRMEPEDPDIIYTALREAEEEIGVDPVKVEVLGKLSNLYIPASNFLVTPIIGFLEERPRFLPDLKEVAKIIPTDFQKLTRPSIRKNTILQLDGGIRLDTPFFDIEGEVVWGATAMILSELLQLMKDKNL